jgi:3-phytase
MGCGTFLRILSAVCAICGPVLGAGCGASSDTGPIQPIRGTDTVSSDPDDPAIWLHASDPAKSLIIATDKIEVTGGLYVFGLDGKLRQRIAPLDRPNNVDVEYGVALGDRRVDVAVVTERKQHRLRIFEIPADGGALIDLAPAGLPVLEGQTGEEAEPMGIALYKRPRDGAVFAIVAPKTGGTTDYLWQYRIEGSTGSTGSTGFTGSTGSVTAAVVRRFGAFSRVGAEPGDIGEIEAVTVDDALGYVYYSDERAGIRKYAADPDAADPSRELALFGTTGYQGDREGLAIYTNADGTGFIVSSDQIEGGTRVHLYRREGASGRPHDHDEAVRVVATMSDETDGLDVTSRALPDFPAGLLVMMNSGARNFLLYRWEDLVPTVRTEGQGFSPGRAGRG